jgi:integrase
MLSEAKIRTLKPAQVRREIPDGKVPGLYYVLQPSGKSSWCVRYRFRGKPWKFTLAGVSSLKDAHRRAEEVRGRIARGENPAAEKASQRAPQPEADPDSFAAAVDVFLARYVTTHQNPKSARLTEHFLNAHVLPRWGDKRLQDIRRRDVHELMEAITDHGARVSANRTLSVLKTCWRFWISRDMAEWSPVQMIGKPTKERPRERVLTDDELRAVLGAVEGCGWPYVPIVKLLAATGCRRDEIAGLRWSEIDLDGGLIEIPSSRRKGGIAHSVPMSSMARATIEDLPRFESEWLFPARRGGGHFSGFVHAKRRLDELSGVQNWVLHDLRRSMATKMQGLGIRAEVIEKCLGHEQRGIQRTYQRHAFIPEMTTAFEAWAKYLDGLRHPGQGPANVVHLRTGAQ